MNSENIKKYLQKYIDITETEAQHFLALIETKNVEKGQIVLDFDKKCNYQYFVLEGLLISYNVNENGENKVIQISTENTWTGDLNSYINDQFSNRIIIASEKSRLAILKKENWVRLLNINNKYEKLFRIIFQSAYIQQTKRLESTMKYDSKTRLKNFIAENPTMLNRVQKKIIASYLDMTPETLSRLLKKQHT